MQSSERSTDLSESKVGEKLGLSSPRTVERGKVSTMKSLAMMIFVALVLPVFGELSKDTYLKMQNAAPEEISIKVLSIKRQGLFRKNEEVTATVTKVVRSGSKLKVGDKITIKYRHVPLRGAAGPSPIPKLKKETAYPAWLKKNAEGIYEPAARGMSFTRLDPE